jgi:hypothetical protein
MTGKSARCVAADLRGPDWTAGNPGRQDRFQGASPAPALAVPLAERTEMSEHLQKALAPAL